MQILCEKEPFNAASMSGSFLLVIKMLRFVGSKYFRKPPKNTCLHRSTKRELCAKKDKDRVLWLCARGDKAISTDLRSANPSEVRRCVKRPDFLS